MEDMEHPRTSTVPSIKNRRIYRRSVAIGFLVFGLALVVAIVCDLLLTRPRHFTIDSAQFNLASTLPTAGATVGVDRQPRLSKVVLKSLTCNVESGSIFIGIESISKNRYELSATVAQEDLESHGDLVWNAITGQKAAELRDCRLKMKIWIAYVMPVKYTYAINKTGSCRRPTSDRPKKAPMSVTLAQDTLLLQLRPALFEIPPPFPIQVTLPEVVLTAGTAKSRKALVYFAGANNLDVTNSSEPLQLSVTCDSDCAWYEPMIDVALEGGEIVNVTLDANQTFLEHVFGRQHEVVMGRKTKEIPGRYLEAMRAVDCFEIGIPTSGAFADLCGALRISESIVVAGEFEGFGSKGGASGRLDWSEMEKDKVQILMRSTASLNDNDKIDLSGNATLLLSELVEVSAYVANEGSIWPMAAGLLASMEYDDDDDVFSIKLDTLYASWMEDILADAEAAFSLNFTEGTLNGFFMNVAPDWPIQSTALASASFGDDAINATLERFQLVWRDDVLLETVGSFGIDLDEYTLFVTVEDPSFSCFLDGSLVEETVTMTAFLAIDGLPTFIGKSSGFLRDLEFEKGFQFGSISTATLDSDEELDLSVNLVFLDDNWDIDFNATNAAGRWPMDCVLQGRTPNVTDSAFRVIIDTIFFSLRETVYLDTTVNFGIDFDSDFILYLQATDPNFTVSANTLVNVADNNDLPVFIDSARGTLTIVIDKDTVVQLSFDGVMVWSNVDKGFRLTGTVKEEALLAAALSTILDVRYDKNRTATLLERLLIVVEEESYVDAFGSLDIGFDSASAQCLFENTAWRYIRSTGNVSWALLDGNATSLEVQISEATMDWANETLFSLTGSVYVEENAEDTVSGNIALLTDNDAALVAPSTRMMFRFVPNSFLLEVDLSEGKLSIDGKDYVDCQIDLIVQEGEDNDISGAVAVASLSTEAFFQVDGEFAFRFVPNSFLLEADLSEGKLSIDGKDYVDCQIDLIVQEGEDHDISGEVVVASLSTEAFFQVDGEFAFRFVPNLFLLEADLSEGKLSIDGKDYVDCQIDLIVQESEDHDISGAVAVASLSTDAFFQVDGEFVFVLDKESFSARLEPCAVAVDSVIYTNMAADVALTTDSASFSLMDSVNALTMIVDRAMVHSLDDDGLNVTVEGVFLDVPGQSSPWIDGGMGVAVDLEREIAVLHLDNNTTLFFVDATVTFDFASIVSP